MKIGIIGGGKMGQLFKKNLQKKHRVFLYSEHGRKDSASLKKIYQRAEILILASPKDTLKKRIANLAEISREFKDEKVVFDISSFKSDIIGLYTKFPKHVKVASVHPMFGPGAKTFIDKLFLVVPVPGREKDAVKVLSFLNTLKGVVKILDVETHDRMMGRVIGVPYFIGLSYLQFAEEMGLEQFGGTSYRFMKTYALAVLNDSPEFINEILKKSQKEIREFVKSLENGHVELEHLKDVFSGNIEDAYSRLYRVLED